MMLRRRVLERTSKEGKRPVSEKLNRLADTRVPQDTRNPVELHDVDPKPGDLSMGRLKWK